MNQCQTVPGTDVDTWVDVGHSEEVREVLFARRQPVSCILRAFLCRHKSLTVLQELRGGLDRTQSVAQRFALVACNSSCFTFHAVSVRAEEDSGVAGLCF